MASTRTSDKTRRGVIRDAVGIGVASGAYALSFGAISITSGLSLAQTRHRLCCRDCGPRAAALAFSAVSYRIEAATEPTPEIEHALTSLLPQLNPALAGPRHEQLKAVMADPASTLLLVIDDGAIVGTATVIVYTTPAWVKARIEDVVVDESVRGRGIGEALVSECIKVARMRGANVVELQSARRREVANRLYPRMGFQLRDSNVYRITLD